MSRSSLAWWLYAHAPPQAEDLGKFGLACLTCYRQRRVGVSLLRGPTHTGATATVLTAGDASFLTQHIFAEPPTREVVGESPWWMVRRHLRASADLSIALVPRLVATGIAGRDCLVVPEWISLRVPVPDDVRQASRLSGSVADDLRIVRRNRLTHSLVAAPEGLDDLYTRMYVPFIRRRYGATAPMRNLRHLRVLCRYGGLLWLERDGQRIAGLVFQRRNDQLRVLCVGTLDGDYRHVKAGAMAALYAAVLEHARGSGCTLVDFGGTRPSVTDGLFRYKRKWGGAIAPYRDCVSAYVVRWDGWNDVVADLLARTGLVVADQGRFSAVRVITDGQSPSAAHRECWTAGLSQLHLISDGACAVAPPPQTTLSGPLSSAALRRQLRRCIPTRRYSPGINRDVRARYSSGGE
ncbi:MAG TPA: GNAT family N-acetyltransferase [Candidatus Methylomirabilis sp.]|nr:GNAT family N-acetyltransferase [Candidatus Methylomirabilis sp.]